MRPKLCAVLIAFVNSAFLLYVRILIFFVFIAENILRQVEMYPRKHVLPSMFDIWREIFSVLRFHEVIEYAADVQKYKLSTIDKFRPTFNNTGK